MKISFLKKIDDFYENIKVENSFDSNVQISVNQIGNYFVFRNGTAQVPGGRVHHRDQRSRVCDGHGVPDRRVQLRLPDENA